MNSPEVRIAARQPSLHFLYGGELGVVSCQLSVVSCQLSVGRGGARSCRGGWEAARVARVVSRRDNLRLAGRFRYAQRRG